jgi:hypothetical protein
MVGVEKGQGSTRRIACVDWHDGEVGTVLLRLDGTSVISFTHLPVYHEINIDKFEIWSYRAALHVFGLQRCLLDGPAGDVDYISDVHAVGDDGLVNSGLLPIDVKVAVEKVEMIFGSGRKLEFYCSHVRLVLEETLEHVENWDGPLRTNPSPQ